MEVRFMVFYWTRKEGNFEVGRGGVDCDVVFSVTVTDKEATITRRDRFRGKVLKEETRTVPLTEFVDAIVRLWWGNGQ
jgi:hypothetical protein